MRSPKTCFVSEVASYLHYKKGYCVLIPMVVREYSIVVTFPQATPRPRVSATRWAVQFTSVCVCVLLHKH